MDRKKKTRFFEIYISKIIKDISPENGITTNAKQQLNSVTCIILKIIANKVVILTEIAKKKTISEKEVKNSLLISLPNKLSLEAVENGEKALQKYIDVDSEKRISKQERAGIIFPPSQTEKFLRNFGYLKIMVSKGAPIFLAGALEYIVSKILSSSIKVLNNSHVRITIRDLEIGVRTDDALNCLFTMHNISFLGGGVVPYIHSSLLIKRERKIVPKPKISIEQIMSEDTCKILRACEKKKHRFRPGTVSVREIKRLQKMSDCLSFSKYSFEQLVRENINKINPSLENQKIGKDVFIILQYFIEQQIVNILYNANFASIHASRLKLSPIDIEFVYSIMTGQKNPHKKDEILPETDFSESNE